LGGGRDRGEKSSARKEGMRANEGEKWVPRRGLQPQGCASKVPGGRDTIRGPELKKRAGGTNGKVREMDFWNGVKNS